MTDALSRLGATLADRYRVERELGAGGMATVYLAEDVRHDRKVALKVLRPELAAVIGAERFLKEIKVTANLQHPHILGLIDSGEADGLLYYVMPFIEGESLRDRLRREKQLPIDEAVRIAREVASALDYAHRHHVIHRDIKPENVLLHDGAALVADFGIALAVSTAGGTRMTETGMSLGTPHYMSPEQAMGEREITARSDVYALGAVLYEMLAGEPPFTGPTAQAIIARVMTDAPRSLVSQRHTVPAHVEAAVATALEKLPADRFGTAAAFAEALAAPGAAAAARASAPRRAAAGLRGWRGRLPLAAAAVGLVIVGGLAGRFTADRTAASPVTRFTVPLGSGVRLNDAPTLHLALSPDGTQLVYNATAGGLGSQLFLRPMSALAAVPIPGTDLALSPVFSPDGGSLAFVVDNQIKRVSVAGGSAVAVAPAPGAFDVAWTDDGQIVFNGQGGALWAVPADGGTPAVAVAPDSSLHEREIILPDALPGGRAVLATVIRSASMGGSDLVRIDLRTGARTVIVQGRVVQGRYLPGHVVYALDDGSLHTAPFDPERGVLTGRPSPVLSNLRITFRRTAQFAVSRTGTLAYAASDPARIALVNRDGAITPVTGVPNEYHHLRFSPDGRRLAMDITQSSGRDVWVRDLDQGTLTRVTFEGDANDPVWTPDGRRVCYGTARAGVRGVWCRGAAGGAAAESVYVGPRETTPGAFTRDGRLILIGATPTGLELLLYPPGGSEPTPLLSAPSEVAWPALSPDGRWLAYVSNESGRHQVYIWPFAGEGDRVQVSADGGTEPAWSRDGRELYYVTERNGVMAVRVEAGPRFRVLERRLLYTLPDIQTATPHANFDVDARGRFAMILRPASSDVVMVLNWGSELGGR